MLWEQFMGPVSRLWEHWLSDPSKAMGTLLPLVTQTPGWGSQTASTYPTFILLWLNVYFFLLFQIVNLSPSFLPFTVGSLYILLYFTLYILHFFLHFVTELSSVSILITSVLNSASDRLSTSSSLSSFFWSFDLFFHLCHVPSFLCSLILAASLCLFLCIR